MSHPVFFMPEELEDAQQELSTVLDMARWSFTQFNRADVYLGHGTDNGWDEALSLLAHVLHLPQPLHQDFFKARTTRQERLAILEFVQRRIDERLPLAYLTNEAWFCGLPFYVDERVLIPRSPFSELIDNRFENYLESAPQNILDMCTGSACIAIAAAHAFPGAHVDAVDISNEALQVADINIQEHQLAERVFPIESNLFEQLEGQHYDLIICNPPYVDAEDMDDLPEEFHHEPRLGLAAGQDGLDLIPAILRGANKHLNEGGWLFIEVGNSQVHMLSRFPELPIVWVNLHKGGHGILAINKQQLSEYFSGEQQQ
ncbi:MAG: 50S ribosomal protein L3 N(5)-glutamine methyltransferase [Aestuariibacter sp.]